MSVSAGFSRSTSWPAGFRSPDRLRVYAAIAAASFVSYILARVTDGGWETAFLALGLGACGWAWLLARALFDPKRHDAWWARIVGLTVAVSAALAVLAPEGGLPGRVADNVYAISGSAALLLTFVEPFNRYSPDLPGLEKRFRLAFLAVNTVLVALSMLGLWASSGSAADALRDDLVKGGCAVVGLCGAMAAVWFRLRHPLETTPPRRIATIEDTRLAERLTRLLREQALDQEPDLRIADVAARLNEPEYRVSQCIRAALGFGNFNRWINHHRIERARAALADPQDERSILVIAFDCGFGSIGPFNRAFREQVGTTPRAYRSATKASNAAA